MTNIEKLNDAMIKMDQAHKMMMSAFGDFVKAINEPQYGEETEEDDLK